MARTLTQQLDSLKIPSIASTAEQSEDKHKVYARLFALGSAATWLIIGYDPKDRMLFGYADLYGGGDCAEWGYISLDELEALKFGSIPKVERDRSFKKQLFPLCVRENGAII